jgi:DNA-binding IclR family transcriptional regulator
VPKTSLNEDSLGNESTATVISKISSILLSFDDADSGLNLKQIVDRTGVPRSTVHRLCNELVRFELLSRHDNLYELGRVVMGASGEIKEYKNIRTIAEPHLYDLFALTNCGVHFAVRQGLTTRFLARIVSVNTKQTISRIWGERPLHTTASGKTFLAFEKDRVALMEHLTQRSPGAFTSNTFITKAGLQSEVKRIRQIGYSTENEELLMGWRAIAAPIWKNKDEIVATVSLSAEIGGMDIDLFIPELLKTADNITKLLRK